jgi:hypothetical protein
MKSVNLILLVVSTLTPDTSAGKLWKPNSLSPLNSAREYGDLRYATPAKPSGKISSEAAVIRGGSDSEGGKATILSSVFNLGMLVGSI